MCFNDGYADTVKAGARRTDGTDETDFFPPIHPINKPLPPRQTSVALPYQHTSSCCNEASTDTAKFSLPSQPLPIYQQHGMDGHHSRTEIDHPNDRPRARHRRSSLSSHSHYTSHRDSDSAHSYHSGPSVESGSAGYSSSSRSGS